MDWAKLLSSDRLRPPSVPLAKGDEGNAFQSDYQRVVFSSAFRRLQDKTQVNPLATHDYVRRRLTHSLEVATVGERMGRVLASRLGERAGNAKPDDLGKIVATACLLHDIGNPPFGHEGEVAIREWCDTHAPTFDDYRSFDGNAHGFRTAVRLNNLGASHGINLTVATLGCTIKYAEGAESLKENPPPAKSRKTFGYFESEENVFRQLWERLGLEKGSRHPLSFVMEAADDIVNRLVDLEDGLKLCLIGYDTIRDCMVASAKDDHRVEKFLQDLDKTYREVAGDHPTSRTRREAQQKAFENFRAIAIGKFSESAEEAFTQKLADIEAGQLKSDLTSVFDYNQFYKLLKKVEYENIFGDQSIVRVEAGGKAALKGLLDLFFKAVKDEGDKAKLTAPLTKAKVFNDEVALEADYVRIQQVVDYVAGMTDRFAIELYQQLSGVSL